MRSCPHCHAQLAPSQLLRHPSAEMELERRTQGLAGFRFRYYSCPSCDFDDVFVDVLPLPDETDEQLARRKQALEEAVRKLHAERTNVVIGPP